MPHKNSMYETAIMWEKSAQVPHPTGFNATS